MSSHSATSNLHKLLLEAIARGYCTTENSSKEIDATLCKAMADEVEVALVRHSTPVSEIESPLVAAAPDLLAACAKALSTMKESVANGCTDHLDCWDDTPWYSTVKDLAAAIKKASGA